MLENTSDGSQPFGDFIIRENNVYFMYTYYEAGVRDFRLYKSTDNFATVPTFTIAIANTDYVEPSLIDIRGGKSIILARIDSGAEGSKSFVQYNSNDGINFTYKGETNIFGDVNRSIRCPVAIKYDSERNELIAVAGDRGKGDNVEIDSEDLELGFISKMPIMFSMIQQLTN